jgi:hypothetical protein
MGEVVPFLQSRYTVHTRNPDTILSTAADLSLADSLRACAEVLVNHIERTQQPLGPVDRKKLMRAVAVLRNEPLS